MRLMQQLLPSMVDLKLQYLDFVRNIPPEQLEQIKQRVSQSFNEEQLDVLVDKAQLTSAKELDAKLRELESSVEHQRRLFLLQVFAGQARNQNISINQVVSPDEMLAYYHEHLADYEYPAQARWERLMVRFDKFDSKQEARDALARMGNRVVYGAPFAEVAKQHSQGPRAAEGGFHDWTTQGSLVSEVLDRALFTLPVNRLSKPLEDERAGYIIRVIERRDAGRVSFVEAQKEIEEKIKNQRREAKQQEYLTRLREQTQVWTIFDDEQRAAEQRTAAEPPRPTPPGYR
jgi:parvulin-like peptidyl-prolyl isomerase